MRSPIELYLQALGRALAFDPALAQRVCAEAEDHLRECCASCPDASPEDAEAQAIERFGSVPQLAAPLARAALRRTLARLSQHLLLLTGLLFAAMQWRVAAIAQIVLEPRLPPLALLALPVHQLSFCLAALSGVLGFAVSRWPLSDTQEGAADLRLRAVLMLSLLSALSLLGSVAMESYLTLTKLGQARPDASVSLPAGLLGGEIALLLLLLVVLARVARQALRTWKLLTP